MTNLERIKQMDVEEMAAEFRITMCNHCKGFANGTCIYTGYSKHTRCLNGIKAWLEQEVEE